MGAMIVISECIMAQELSGSNVYTQMGKRHSGFLARPGWESEACELRIVC
jgi:hypothetical protein